MTGTIGHLLAAAVLFVVSHIVLSAGSVRRRFVQVLGEWPFRGFYSAIALVVFAWMIVAFREAPALVLWSVPISLKHIPIGIMPFVAILLVAGYTTLNPTAVGMERFKFVEKGPTGILKVTRHPILWAFSLWALLHMLASGDAARLVLFGSVAVLGIAGSVHLDVRKEQALGSDWIRFKYETSNVPFAALLSGRTRMQFREIGWWRVALGVALYAVLLMLHRPILGYSPLASMWRSAQREKAQRIG